MNDAIDYYNRIQKPALIKNKNFPRYFLITSFRVKISSSALIFK